MSDVTNQIDIIDNRFFDQRLKVPRVVCQQRVIEIGDLIMEAPPGVTFDSEKCKFNVPLSVEVIGPPIPRDITVCIDTVINQGVVPARLVSPTTTSDTVLIPRFEIPFQAVTICKGVLPGDIVQKHDVQINCTSIGAFFKVDPVDPCKCPKLFLTIKVVVSVCLIVARETVVKVNAAEPFCD